MRYVFAYTLVGALSGACYFFIRILLAGALEGEGVNNLFISFFLGAIGGLVPGILREATHRHIPLFQSWIMLLILVYGMPYFSHHMKAQFYWVALAYGYLGHLLWEAYHKKLPKI